MMFEIRSASPNEADKLLPLMEQLGCPQTVEALCIVDLTSGKRREKDGSHEFYAPLGYENEGYMAKKYLRKFF